MSYRVHEHPKHYARRTVESTATPMRVYLTNGSIADVAFPCFYQEVTRPIPAIHHNRHWHHHVGWPVYNHPDHICQMASRPGLCGHHGGCKTCRHYLDAATIFPIHLEAEGYTGFQVFLDEEHLEDDAWKNQIYASAELDEKQDWVVRVRFWSQIDEHFHKPQRVPFIVRGTAAAGSGFPNGRYDTIAHGELVILPGSLTEAPGMPETPDPSYPINL